MFTGIIESIGKIEKIDGNRYTIFMDQNIGRGRIYASPTENLKNRLEIGESIALSGMCTTVLTADNTSFTVEVMAESRDRTTFGSAHVGDLLNLERSAVIGARNSGHFVTGHIDEVGKILKISHDRDYWRFRISFSSRNSLFLVEKGSVAVDGISLTVASVDKEAFEVGIISHTFEMTNLSQKKEGDTVNLEFDILGKYVLNASH